MESEAFSAQATLAHYWDDAPTDTLAGAHELPIATISEPSAVWTAIYTLLATMMVYWIGHYVRTWLRSRREKIAQLELRRRHGIPDSDTRPFNVAYHAASIAARDAKRQSMSAQPEPQANVHGTQNSSVNVMEGLRPQARARPPIPTFPGQPPVRVPSGHFTFAPTQPQPAPNSAYGSTRGLSHFPHSASTPSWGPGYDADGFRATSVPTVPTVATRSAFAVAAVSTSRRSSGAYGSLSGAGDRRTWSSAARPVPTSHSTGNLSQARARKRLYLTADEEADQQAGLPNDKRSRTAGWGSEAMIDGDNEPLWAQSYPVESKQAPEQYEPQTGKSKGKRLADDADGDLRVEGKRRHTKSKSHRPKPSAVQETRGTKRERKEIDTASALNDVMPVHKRGRAGDVDLSMVQEEDDADEEEDPTISRDPLCGGRRIGQKWTANGQEYMVGANGERLRFVTVKESRKRYYMPADSKHADNLHMVEVFVEKWLNEEQYAKAKADGLLAWQENENLPKDPKPASSDKASEGKENQSQEERPRSISTTAITVSRAQRTANTVWNTPGQSPLTTHSLTNPFNTPPSATTPEASGPRRVRYSMGTLPPTSTMNRSISVWEKQEKEAAALKILRERRKAEADKAAPAPAPVPAPTPAPVPVTIPTLTVTAPSVESTTPRVSPPAVPTPAPAAPSVKAPSFSFAPAAPKPADPAPAPTPAASNPFSFAPKKDEAPKVLFPTAPAPAATTASSAPLFPPPAVPSASAAPAPSPFGAPATTTTSGASPFGAPTPTVPSKPPPFSFAAPSTAPQPAPASMASPFGAPASTPAAPSTAAPPAPSPFNLTPAAPSPAATKPMGGFTFGPGAASTTPSAPVPSPFAAPAAKPAANTFSFNTGNANSNATTQIKPVAAPTPSGFGNTAGSSNVFGSNAPKPTNVFGNTPSGTAPTGLGNGFGANNGAGAAPSPFAFGANKPAATPSTTSGFGAQPSAPAFGAPNAAPAASTFKFGDANGNSSAAPATTSGFQFGAPKPTLSIPATSVFGAPPSATPTATNGGTFTFGAGTSAPTQAGAAASPATPSKPLFSLGAAAASPVMGTRQISTSKRVQRAMSKPPQ